MRTVWLSAMNRDEAAVQKIMSQFKTYGIDAQGHFWENDNAKMAWLGANEALLELADPMWVILGDREAFEETDLRYGLSMTALSLLSRKSAGFPMVLLQTGGEPLSPADLPTPLSGATVLDAQNTGTPAKLVAKAHAQAAPSPADYYLDMVGDAQVGQWLEVRPTRDTWPGVIFGVDDGEIVFQAVGAPGRLPEKTSLSYAMQGLKLETDDGQFTAWATRNAVSADSAYYVKINGCPKTLLFGAYCEDEQAQLYRVHLV